MPGAAYATVSDTGVWGHIRGWENNKCLYDAHTGVLEVYNCENTPFEQWQLVGAQDHLQIVNHATGNCIVPGTPGGNSTAILLATCDSSDPRQFWNEKRLDGVGPGDHVQWVGSEGFCMDRPTQASNDGEHLQMWQCDAYVAPIHFEQLANWTQSI